jgi:general secretion pathway protein C
MRSRFPIVRLTSVALFALLCAIVAWWALQLLAHQAPVAPAGAVARSQAPVDLAQAGRLFGGTAPAADAVPGRSDIRVTGVVAAGDSGVALLSVDGRPAKAFAVGQQVTEGIRVVAVEPTTVRVSSGGSIRELEAPARGSVAVLTSGPARGAPAAPAPLPGVPGTPSAAPAAPLPGGSAARAATSGPATPSAPFPPAMPGLVTPATTIDATPAGAPGGAGGGPAMQAVPPTPVEPGSSTQ